MMQSEGKITRDNAVDIIKEFAKEKASRILVYKDVNFDNKDNWTEQFEWLMDMALKMKTCNDSSLWAIGNLLRKKRRLV